MGDDQNQEVRDAVLPAVLASASVNPTQFINIVTECRSKHRVTSYCDEAIARPNSWQSIPLANFELYTQTRSHSHTYAGITLRSALSNGCYLHFHRKILFQTF